VVLKTLFFPNHLKENFTTDQERSEYILNNLAKGVN
ncbi:MAG TPA: DUF4492 domain-containing protein, partial [Campylobacterales bacterium]|nr:DUF4492 domain-containing protein [Campylobacterales bacterium]